ncbi:MAG: endolytic transglycosylase MltG, partial [Firmicutes bacterium]|nr:endolytic transglycosylase MltG [Bacillota bacterium]
MTMHFSWGKRSKITAAAGLAVFSCAIAGIWMNSSPRPSAADSVFFTIVPGESADRVAAALKKRGVIRSALIFRIYAEATGAAERLNAGTYRISGGESMISIAQQMIRGQVMVKRVVIPEGFSVHEIASRLMQHHIGTGGQWERIMHEQLAGMPAPSQEVRDPLEGFLFPATYSFPWHTSVRQAVAIMWQTFQQKALPLYNRKHLTLSVTQWVTLASIVQAEAPNTASMPLVAAVFLNRLHQNMDLQSDATVRYALGRDVKNSLTVTDLAVPSPFNTYSHAGL